MSRVSDRRCWSCGERGHAAANCPLPPTTSFEFNPNTHRLVHRPVMSAEVLEAIQPRDGDVLVDGTFGAGGHTRTFLHQAQVKVYAVDRDPRAHEIAQQFAAESGQRVVPILGRIGDLSRLLTENGVAEGTVNGILFDVGVSSMQLDDPARGFSFRGPGPLDMRMGGGIDGDMTAADLVNTASKEHLAEIIQSLSNERRAKAIASAIVGARRRYGPFRTTEQLATVVEVAVGAKSRSNIGIHPATRTFQALRIFVNDELGELESGLTQAARHLSVGGRLAVITFHSLELHTLRRFARQSGKLTAIENLGGLFSWTGPHTPSDAEVESNKRSRSATLMIGEKVSSVSDGGREPLDAEP